MPAARKASNCRPISASSGATSTRPAASIRSSISTTAAASERRLVDRQVEQPRAVLIADVQDVAKAPRRDQRRPGPAARDQGVGAARRTQPHARRAASLPRAASPASSESPPAALRPPTPARTACPPPGPRPAGRPNAACRGGLETRHVRLGQRLALIIEKPQPPAGPKVVGIAAARRVDDPIRRGSSPDGPFDHARAEQLVVRQRPVRPPRKTIGERAADVDPEFPGGHASAHACQGFQSWRNLTRRAGTVQVEAGRSGNSP